MGTARRDYYAKLCTHALRISFFSGTGARYACYSICLCGVAMLMPVQ